MNAVPAFAVWITGLPASGKTSITREVVKELERSGIHAVVLESDEMRRILTPEPTYREEERDWFYTKLAQIGSLIVRQGIPVVYDATANKRLYRDYARSLTPKFAEVFVRCPLAVCVERDPKGIYRDAAVGKNSTVPGLQTAYEQPGSPEVVLDGEGSPEENALLVLQKLKTLHYI